MSDVRQKDGVWVFDINDTGDKEVKTEAGKRIVPVHPALIELGILDRVNNLKAQGHTLLFPDLKPKNAVDKYGEKVGTWFGRYRRKQGVHKDKETNQKKDFHSFRHTVISALLVAGVDRNKYKEVVGHEGKDEDVTDLYEHGYPASVLRDEVITKLDFSEALDFDAMKGSPWIEKA